MSFTGKSASLTTIHENSTVDEGHRAIDGETRQARRGLLLFFVFLLLFTALFDGLLLITRQVTFLFLVNVFFVMWTPALASFMARLITREGFRDLSFRIRTRSILNAVLYALLFPLVIGLLAYGIAWFTGLAPLLPFHPTGGLADFLSLVPDHSRLVQVGLALLYLIVIAVIAAAGEEIGWRGYMLPRFLEGKIPGAIVLNGLIWSLWHWPQILFNTPIAGQPQIITACIFLVTITSLGVVSALLQLKTRSLWPTIVLHAAWNTFIVEGFNAFTQGVDTSLWTGESGILVAATMLVVVLCIYFYMQKYVRPL